MFFKIRVLKNNFLQDFNFDNSVVKVNFREIQILIFWISFSTIFLRFAKLFSSTVVVVSSRIMLARGRSLFLRTVFFKSIFSKFPGYKKKENPRTYFLAFKFAFNLDFAFVANPKSVISPSFDTPFSPEAE